MTHILSTETPIIQQFLRQLRDKDLQQDRLRIAENLELLGTLLGYELGKQLSYTDHATTTSLGTANTPLPADQIVLATVLRAGLPVQRGLQRMFPAAELGFVGAARREGKPADIVADVGYIAAPKLDGKVLIVADTMLATGKSLVTSIQAMIKSHGQPKKLFIAAVIASQTGVDYITSQLPEAELLVCVVDAELNSQAYIVPGLGDAGDLLYGPKL